MSKEFFSKEKTSLFGREAIKVTLPGFYSLKDTFECGQCFRYQRVREDSDYIEYMTVIGDSLVLAGQRKPGEIYFFGATDEEFENVIRPYFTLDTDYEAIRKDICSRTDSAWLKNASECAKGIAILKQEPWEALFSFIVSQNNNIPRIRKIISQICAAYGVNLCLQKSIPSCPLSKIEGTPCEEKCKSCGMCYSFPEPCGIMEAPEKLLPSKPGFRYKYLLDAAEKVSRGEINLQMIAAARTYSHTVEVLKGICGVGDKVASCVALFGFGNLDAFPIDVWMKRAIDEYFDGKLSPESLGRYAGVAQQYIFHYIRNLSEEA